MKKSISLLSISTKDSYQTEISNIIKCCICLEEVNNEDSFMPECKHSWCKECNDNLNKHYINSCPICKIKFKSILRKGRWNFIPNQLGGEWKWEEGYEDAKKYKKIRKIQQFFYNFGTLISLANMNNI